MIPFRIRFIPENRCRISQSAQISYAYSYILVIWSFVLGHLSLVICPSLVLPMTSDHFSPSPKPMTSDQ
jgi:hypothetical protein